MIFLDFFAGVGGFRRGMELAGHECVGFCEWDKFATASYTSMHLITEEQRQHLATLDLKYRQKEILKDEYRNGEWYSTDIRNVDAGSVPRADCWCFGAPCQDFSVAGKRAGLDGDRSSLVRQVFRILGELKEEDRPEWLIYENVKGMLSSNKGFDFLSILLEMDELGYDIEWQLFNSKDWGMPQNRERVYTIGHLRSRGERKIFPVTGTDGENSVPISIMGHRDGYRRNTQVFAPDGITETLCTAACGGTGPHVGLNVIGLINGEKDTFGADRNRILGDGHTPSLRATDYKDPCKVAIPIGKLSDSQDGKVYSHENISQCLSAGHNNQPKVTIPVLTPDRAEKCQNGRRFKEDGEEMFTLTAQDRHGVGIKVKEATKQGYSVAHEGDAINLAIPGSKTRRGRVGVGVAQTLDTSCNQGIMVQMKDFAVYAVWYEKYQCYIAIRKLTPKECFRLQGWTDDYFEKAQFVNYDSQLYKQAGNGVTVNVVYEIAKRMT